ncbi:MAG: hypothetical protein AB8G05_20000 [Oligoflexales bacterium]
MSKVVLCLSIFFISNPSFAKYAHIISREQAVLLFDNHEYPIIKRMFPNNIGVVTRALVPGHFINYGMNMKETQVIMLNALFIESNLLGVVYFTPSSSGRVQMLNYCNPHQDNISIKTN